MDVRQRLVMAVAIWLLLPWTGSAATVTKRLTTGTGDTVIVTCRTGPPAVDYVAETESGIPLTDPYAMERGADQGLVHLEDEGGRRTKQFIIPRRLIRMSIRVDASAPMPDWIDLIFTSRAVFLVQTTASNAGIFTSSRVFRLRYDRTAGIDRDAFLKAGPDRTALAPLLDLAAYQAPGSAKVPSGCR